MIFLNRTVCSLKVRYLSVHQLFLLFENTLLNMPIFTKFSLCLRALLTKKNINSNISFCKIKVFFKSSTRLANFFRFKDKTPLCLHSNIVYKFMCGRCNATYYGKTCHYFKVRVGKHSGISPLTNKWSKSKKSTAVKDHMLMFYQPVSFDDFKVPASSDYEFHWKIKESLQSNIAWTTCFDWKWTILAIICVWLGTKIFYSLTTS